MSQRAPYLEIALTVAVLAFLAFVVVGGFNQHNDDIAQATMRPY
jgi:TRAP-type C4-dicarboxylate transport system permease small subunit